MAIIKKCLLLFVLFSGVANAEFKGMVTALEAPIFRTKNMHAPVIQYVRKGDIIYISPSHFRKAPYEKNYEKYTESLGSKDSWQSGEDDIRELFYTTLDQNAQVAYIPKEYVKLIYNDSRENDDEVKFKKIDETDYRLNEPLAPKYPFRQPTGYRGFISIGTGNDGNEHYNYKNTIVKENKGRPLDLHWAFMVSPEFDTTHSFFYGIMFTFKFLQNKFQMENSFESSELNMKIGFGPIVGQDFFRNDQHRISYYGGFLVYLFNQNRIKLSNSYNQEELRVYQGFNLNPQIGVLYQLLNVFPNGDFVVNGNVEVNTRTKLTNKTGATYASHWQTGVNDSVNRKTFLEYNLLLGYQVAF